jgi:hypothetical protein
MVSGCFRLFQIVEELSESGFSGLKDYRIVQVYST